MRIWAVTFAAVGCLAALAPALEAAVPATPRRPRGIYAVVNVEGDINQQKKANPAVTHAELDAYFNNLYQDLLGNPAIAGLTLQVHWDTLNPNPPAAANAYDWSYVDDAFNQAAAWDAQNPGQTLKGIQLIVTAGFQSPQWMMSQIPSCDGLFQTPVQTPPSTCGKATFMGFLEAGDSTELPLPWNPVYKSAWKTFLTAVAAHYGSNPGFVSIAVAGPTAASAEMLMPNNNNSPRQEQFGGIQPNDMWLQLLAFHYTGMAAYLKSDQAFIDEWNAAIDVYGQVFSGVTLVATTGNGLPNLGNVFTTPSAFKSDCPIAEMDCAAETTILAHFVDPTVGGANAKATQTSGMEASRANVVDLGLAGVKRLAQTTAALTTPAAQILGGAQFNTSFSQFTLQEGCTSTFPPDAADTPAGCVVPPTCSVQACLPVACIPQACLAPGVNAADLTSYKTYNKVPANDLIPPEQAEYNVLKVYFDGTAVASTFGATQGATPLNYLQIYAPDIQYAEANVNAPAQVVETGGATVSMSAQDLLNLASQKLLQIGVPALPPAPSLSIQKTWNAGAAGVSPLRGGAFTYTITVTNTGNGAASGVTVKDTPDSRAELALQGPVTFNLLALAAGATQTVMVKASAGAVGTYSNAASVTWSDASGNSATANARTTTAVGPQPGDLTASTTSPVALKTGVRQVAVDSRTVYVVNNPGDSITSMDCTGGACSGGQTVTLAAGSKPIALVLMDVDGDGFNDVLVLNQGTGTVTALLSGSPGSPVTSSVGAGPLSFAGFSAGDGVPRIAVTFAGTIGVFAWNGQQFQPSGSAAAGQSPAAIVKADFNGDGVDDLLVTNTTAGTVQVWLGDGMGGFQFAGEVPVGAGPIGIATGDVNNDGWPDAAVSTSAGLVLLLNDGTGNLVAQPAIAASGAGAVVLADFNGDGNLDAAVANGGGASVNLYRGDGTGGLRAAGVYLTGMTPVSLAASDLTGSGWADLIVGDSGTQDLTLLLFAQAAQ